MICNCNDTGKVGTQEKEMLFSRGDTVRDILYELVGNRADKMKGKIEEREKQKLMVSEQEQSEEKDKEREDNNTTGSTSNGSSHVESSTSSNSSSSKSGKHPQKESGEGEEGSDKGGEEGGKGFDYSLVRLTDITSPLMHEQRVLLPSQTLMAGGVQDGARVLLEFVVKGLTKGNNMW